MRFEDKRVAVTGAASGIGAAVAAAFAGEGARVAFLDIDEAGAAENAKSAAQGGGECFAQYVDVADKKSVDEAFEAVAKRFGGLDILVYCAGVSIILPFLECDEKIWDFTLDVNLKGMFLCMQDAVKMMREGGSVVCMSSQSGKVGASHYQAYCASKFGVIGLVQSVALEFADKGIRANAVCPGVVYTPMWDKQVESYGKKRGLKKEEVMPYFKSKIPLKRLGELEDVVNMTMFLAGDEASYITGQSMNVSGGQIMF